MKLVSLFLALLAGAYAQPGNTGGRMQTMPLEEIARRMIRQQFQGRATLPERITFSSVQVNSQGTDNYVVNAKFTLRGFYSDRTVAHDYDGRFKLWKEAGSWRIEADSANMGPGRYEAKSAVPPLGETDVTPSAAATQPGRGVANLGGVALPEGRNPLPDFSTLQMWYEIRKWDYNQNNVTMTLLVKPKVEVARRPITFVVKFLDREGLDVESSPAYLCCFAGRNPDNKVEELHATMPRESQMDKVRSVIVFRTKDDGTNVRY